MREHLHGAKRLHAMQAMVHHIKNIEFGFRNSEIQRFFRVCSALNLFPFNLYFDHYLDTQWKISKN